jgi:nucleoside-diphosphate-sugar epimerase
MAECLFLARASGVIGRGLAPLLVASGWRVVGTTRSDDMEPMPRELGVEPVIIDVFDADRLRDAMAQARPSVVVHQLTALPPALGPNKMADALVRNARIWEEGTRNLVSAAIQAGARRLIAQSVAFVYAPGPLPHSEQDPLDLGPDSADSVTTRGVASLEHQVLEGPLAGVVLRYGRLYGPSTEFDEPWGPAPVHIDAAVKATELAVVRDVTGIFNITEADGTVSSDRARQLLGWDPDWRSVPAVPSKSRPGKY